MSKPKPLQVDPSPPQSQTPSQSKTPTPSHKIPKLLDIFHHLKENIRNMDINCHCINEYNQIYYCIHCKSSVCPKCDMNKHYSHVLIQKAQYELTPNKVDTLYTELKSIFTVNSPFKSINESKQLLIGQVNKMAQTLIDKVTQLQTEKLNEISELFNHITAAYTSMQKTIESTGVTLKNYLIENKDFFGTSTSEEQGTNSDSTNTVFLLNYDFINLTYMKKCQLKELEREIAKDYSRYQSNLDAFAKETITQCDHVLFDTMLKDKTYIEAGKKRIETSIGNYNKVVIAMANNDNNNNVYGSGLEEEDIQKSRLIYPQLNIWSNLVKMKYEKFDELNTRLAQYTAKISQIKRTVYATIHKTKGLKNIESLLDLYESRKSNKADKLFSQRKASLASMNKSKSSTGGLSLLRTKTENSLKGKEDVRLDYDPVIQKYFAYLFLELYGKNFRIETKELQSSHADLLITAPEEDIDNNTMKAIEETNEIVYYDRSNGVMVKEEVPLSKNPFGYTKFPIGCRQLTIKDKLYITGGTDHTQTSYANVLVYDSTRRALKRIMDMNCPRAYHSLVFNDIFSTLMVIGGEHCGSVEVFDPETSRWRILPELIHSRANVSFYFDHLKGFFYAMFGIVGDFVDEEFTDVVEVLDLTQIKEGWRVIELKNSEEIFFKTHVMITPVSNDKILIYGSKKKRANERVACMLDVSKNEVIKIDQKVIEELRVKALISKSLSRVLSQISISSGTSAGYSVLKKSEK